MHERAFAFALSTFLLAPAAASAGWYARQTERATPAGGTAQEMRSEIYYENGKMRVDQGERSTIIYDLRAGRFTMLSHPDKVYLSQSVEEMMVMREQILVQAKAQLAKLPPEARPAAEAQLKQIEGRQTEAARPKPTGKSAKHGSFACEIYTWTGEEDDGEVCLSQKTGVDLADFTRDTTALSEKLVRLGGGKAAGLAMLETARFGFPVYTKRTLKMSGRDVATESQLLEIKAMKVPADRFDVPKGYSLKTIPNGPGMRAAPPPGP